MSAALHLQDAPRPAVRGFRDRLVVAASVLATLGIIVGPGLAAMVGAMTGGLTPVVEESRLSPFAQRVLDEIPGAYRTGQSVVVPAAGDPDVVWISPIADAAVDGGVVRLGVRGLVPFGALPRRSTAPEWYSDVALSDRVYGEVGQLSFACTPAVTGAGCTGTLVTRHEGRWHEVRGGLGAPGASDEVGRVDVLGSGGGTEVFVGWLPPGAETAWATVVGNQYIRDVPARVSPRGTVGGGTAWWVRSSEPVSAVSYRDADGEVLARVAVGD